MANKKTGLLSAAAALYSNHGGVAAMIRSAYFWLAVVGAAASYSLAKTETWIDIAQNILPSLTGFSIAAYALLFAVLDQTSREVLSKPSEELGGKRPLLLVVSSITHAITVQVIAIVYSIIYFSKSIPSFDFLVKYIHISNFIFSLIGLGLTLYAIFLILAVVFSVYRVLEAQAKASGGS